MPTSGNPLVPQGTLNRIRGSINVVDIPALNVTAPFLGKEGISVTFDGNSTQMIQTMTGIVTSGEPFIMANMTVNLLRTQGLANQYKNQLELNSLIGDIMLTPDASTLSQYTFHNCAIQSVDPLKVNGMDAGFVVHLTGYYLINSNLFS